MKFPHMNFIVRIMVVTILWLGPMAAVVQGSYISMETQLSLRSVDGQLSAEVITRNRGDEPAQNVRLEVQVSGKTFVGKSVARLTINQSYSDTFLLGKIFPMPGRYPVFVRTHYQDGNGYQFSALLGSLHDHGQGLSSALKIKGQKADIPVDGSTGIRFTLFNNDTSPHEIEIALHVPDEIIVSDGPLILNLRAKERKDVTFVLKNVSALENSSYTVFLVAGYRDKGKYISSLSSSVVSIKEAQSLFPSISPKWVFTIVFSLFIVFLALQFKPRDKQKR